MAELFLPKDLRHAITNKTSELFGNSRSKPVKESAIGVSRALVEIAFLEEIYSPSMWGPEAFETLLFFYSALGSIVTDGEYEKALRGAQHSASRLHSGSMKEMLESALHGPKSSAEEFDDLQFWSEILLRGERAENLLNLKFGQVPESWYLERLAKLKPKLTKSDLELLKRDNPANSFSLGPILAKHMKKENKSSQCFVATAVYGNPNHEDVVFLRRFRDSVLNRYLGGRVLTRLYSHIGPRLSNLAIIFPIARKIFKGLVWRIRSLRP